MNEWSLVCDVTVYDEGSGLAEVVNVSGGIFYLRWITSTPCYDCASVEDDYFKKVIAYPKEDICETVNIRLMDSQQIIRMRRESIRENQIRNEQKQLINEAELASA